MEQSIAGYQPFFFPNNVFENSHTLSDQNNGFFSKGLRFQNLTVMVTCNNMAVAGHFHFIKRCIHLLFIILQEKRKNPRMRPSHKPQKGKVCINFL